MQANPSQCEVDKTTGAIACRCKRAELTGPGFCQRECDVVELNLGPPINNLDTSELLVGVSWYSLLGLDDYQPPRDFQPPAPAPAHTTHTSWASLPVVTMQLAC